MCLSFWIFSLYLIVYYFNIIFSEALKSQESSTCLHSTPYSVSQTPTTIFMETIRFLMKVNAVQVRIFGIGQAEGKILMNYLFYYAATAAKSIRSCPALCDPIDGSPAGSAVPGILQARILEWVAISFSNAWKWKVKVKSLSRVQLLATLWTAAYQAPLSMGFSRQEYWSGVPLPSPYSIIVVSCKFKCVWCRNQTCF